jgi:cation:H+ antiporter
MMKHLTTLVFVLALALGAALWRGVLPLGESVGVNVLGLVIALVVLVLGADYMVHGAVRLARRLGVSPFFIGVTVVAFGTSAPELAASIGASLKGAGGLAIGNVLGSNIANICLILGVTALISPVPIERSIWRIDAPLMFVITILASLTMLDRLFPWVAAEADGAGLIGRIDAALLLLGLVWYIWFNARSGRIDPEEIEHEIEIEMDETPAQSAERDASGLKAVALFIAGLVGLVLGADLLVDNASAIAIEIGVSEAVIGLTVVAFGTSIPELVFSARAAMKGHSEIAVGNIIGSNVFNLLSVLGIAAMVKPIPVPAISTARDIWVVWGVSLAAMVVMKTHSRVTRPEGALLLVAYTLYTVWVYAG